MIAITFAFSNLKKKKEKGTQLTRDKSTSVTSETERLIREKLFSRL